MGSSSVLTDHLLLAAAHEKGQNHGVNPKITAAKDQAAAEGTPEIEIKREFYFCGGATFPFPTWAGPDELFVPVYGVPYP